MDEVARQIREWQHVYGARDAAVAALLCDRHPGEDIAVTEVTPSLDVRHLTFAQLRERSQARAAALAALGVGAGSRVATHMDKGHDLVVTALAIWRLGAVQVPLFTALAAGAIEQRLTDAGSMLVVVDDEHGAKLRGAPGMPCRIVSSAALEAAAEGAPPAPGPAAVGGDDPFVLLYTSGPTGRPLGIPVPVRALAAFHSHYSHGLDVRPEDVYWNATDPGWSYGLYYGVIAPLLAGHRTVLLRSGFDAELTLDVLSTLGVTNFTAAPAAYRALRATVKTLPYDIVVRRLSSAGEPLGADLADWAFDMFGTALHEHYDRPELGACVGYPHRGPQEVPPRPGSAGVALPGWRLAVLDPVDDVELKPGETGRVALDTAGSALLWFPGYHGDAAATANRFSPDGRWLLTGDAGSRDEDGYVYFSSRDHGAIVTGGYRVNPLEVEAALVAHPAVAEAVVFGEPDEVNGRIVAAEVVLEDPESAGEELGRELQEFVRDRFAGHAGPHRVAFVTHLPRSASGKMRRVRTPQPRSEGSSPGPSRSNSSKSR